ncbi:MAG: general secretion pathway protein GspB [Kangiella sp.]|nr:general secretion pathway protein GspB [Kangiella sp.]
MMLNGKAYSIGDTVMKGMVVEDIMENDLLVNYQGQKVIVPGLTDVNP